jgi:phospholipase/carboxylesterase
MRESATSLPLTHLSFPPHQKPGEGTLSPLLLLLHGIGGQEGDLATLVPALDVRFHVLSLRGPISLGPSSYAWFEVQFTGQIPRIQPHQAEASRQLLIEFIRQVPHHYPVNPEQVFLLGFSQGAIMSVVLSLTRPDLLVGAVALSGRVLPELFAPEGPLAGHMAPTRDLEGFPIFLGHGRQDRVLPVHFGRSARDRLSSLPVALTYREFDAGHAITDACLREVGGWLSARLDGAHGPAR